MEHRPVTTDALIVCDNLVKIYKVADLEVVALQGLDLSIDSGELVAIVGASGSGKSTLQNILGGVDTPTAGRVEVGGQDLASLSEAERTLYRRRTVGFVWQQTKFRIGGRELSYGHTTGRDTALSFVAGHPVDDFTALGEEIYDELMADRIWAGTRALAQMHLDAGQRVWLVTATPVELASIIARRLGLTGALGTVAESVDGVYTGRLVGEILHGPAKAHAVRALAASEGLNLRRCTAYSDSVNDVPMLSAVGTAVAVNPDSELRDVAKARGWQIRDFRTGRKAAKIGVPSVLGAGALAGAVAAGVAYRRR